ncbi:MAG: ROK family transcriptional regulator [Bauldia sp.]|nr:ROK family transcriptional regulator [Bauldia sp.]
MTGTTFYSVEEAPKGRSGGTTQAESRIYNERLVISLIRRHKELSKVELTRLTGLAPQTITTIVNRAAEGGLLVRRKPLRGRLGKPSVPYALNPEGAFSFGLKVDHRSADVVLVNFVGEVLAFEQKTFDSPTPGEVAKFTRTAIARICRKHRSVPAERIAGLGIASPFYQWNWGEEIGIPAAAIEAWKEIDLRAELDKSFDWPVFLFNDATVAASAELMFGSGLGCADFLYTYVGYVVGGGLVLDHHLVPGRNNLAASIGRIPVQPPLGANAPLVPLQEVASVHSLARKLDGEADQIWASPDDWDSLEPALSEWTGELTDGIAQATQSAVALIDVDNLVIDGAMPKGVRTGIAKALRRKLARALMSRPQPFSILEGSFGHLGPVIGGASIPLLVKYSNDKDMLFKD